MVNLPLCQKIMKYNLVHKLLFLESNVSIIYYFVYAHLLDTLVPGDAKYGIRFEVTHNVHKPSSLTQKFDYFWGNRDAKMIYYEHPIIPGVQAKLLLDMSSEVYSITVNRAYYTFSKHKYENVWPPGLHLANLVTLSLLERDILTLHGASFSDKKTHDGCVVLAASNTGKSRTTFASLNDGYVYHSEDLTILDKHAIYTSPLISSQSDSLPNKNVFLKYNLFINKLIGLNMFLPRVLTLGTFRRFFRHHSVTSTSRPRYIFILEKGPQSITPLSRNEALRKVLILNRLELAYSRDHLLLAYSYFNPSLNMDHILQKEKDLIHYTIDHAQCYLIRAQTSEKYIDLIKNIFQQ